MSKKYKFTDEEVLNFGKAIQGTQVITGDRKLEVTGLSIGSCSIRNDYKFGGKFYSVYLTMKEYNAAFDTVDYIIKVRKVYADSIRKAKPGSFKIIFDDEGSACLTPVNIGEACLLDI